MTSETLIAGNMVVQAELQARLMGLVRAAGLADAPDAPCSFIGRVALPDGTAQGFYVRHAADAVLTDAAGHVVLITRVHAPGAGRLAIPGGFLDVVHGVCEDVVAAARRELREETGIAAEVIDGAQLLGVGWRRYQRPFDVRVAWNDLPDTEIRKGDIFMVSTQPVYLRTAEDLTQVALSAGDDASAAQVVRIAELGDQSLGIADQWEMISEIPG